MKTRKQDSEKVNSKARQQARRDFIKKVGVAGAAAVTGGVLGRKGSDNVYAQRRTPPPGPVPTPPRDMQPTMMQDPIDRSKFLNDKRPNSMVDTTAGVVVANAAAVRVIVDRLRDRTKRDAALRDSFMANPRQVLGSVGLNEEIQDELLREMPKLRAGVGVMVARGWCWCTGCCCTNCCVVTNCSGGSIGL